jgi:hypothetical protein
VRRALDFSPRTPSVRASQDVHGARYRESVHESGILKFSSLGQTLLHLAAAFAWAEDNTQEAELISMANDKHIAEKIQMRSEVLFALGQGLEVPVHGFS